MLDLINVSYDTQIPNNVGLSSDRRVLKALEKWQLQSKGLDGAQLSAARGSLGAGRVPSPYKTSYLAM